MGRTVSRSRLPKKGGGKGKERRGKGETSANRRFLTCSHRDVLFLLDRATLLGEKEEKGKKGSPRNDASNYPNLPSLPSEESEHLYQLALGAKV